MTYEEMKKEFIRIKKEELDFINEFVITSNERNLTEYEILTICRRSNYYEKKINDMLNQMHNDIFQEQMRLKKEGKFGKDSVVLEFDVNNEFLSLVKVDEMLKILWIDPETQKFKLTFRRPGYITYPLIFLNKRSRIDGIYLSCGVVDISDDCFTHNEDLRGLYYYLDYYHKFEKPYFEIPVNKILEFEENKIIIENEPYVDLDEAKRIYNEEFLNENNKSMKEIAKSTKERIHELSYSRYPSTKKKALLDKIDELYEKVKGNLISKEIIYKGDFLEILKEIYELPNGKTVKKEKVVKNGGKNAVIVVAITDNNEFVITIQSRINGERIVEFPSGYIEAGEELINAAKRELMEETGYTSDDVIVLDETFTSPGIDNSTTYIVLANNCVKREKTKDDGSELVNYGLFSKEQLKYMIEDNIMKGAINKLAYYNLVNNVDDCNVIYTDSNKKIYKKQKKELNSLYK